MKGTYRTRNGWMNSTGYSRREFVEFLRLRPRTQLKRWQCYCGQRELVEWRRRTYCPHCGRIMIRWVRGKGGGIELAYPTVQDFVTRETRPSDEL